MRCRAGRRPPTAAHPGGAAQRPRAGRDRARRLPRRQPNAGRGAAAADLRPLRRHAGALRHRRPGRPPDDALHRLHPGLPGLVARAGRPRAVAGAQPGRAAPRRGIRPVGGPGLAALDVARGRPRPHGVRRPVAARWGPGRGVRRLRAGGHAVHRSRRAPVDAVPAGATARSVSRGPLPRRAARGAAGRGGRTTSPPSCTTTPCGPGPSPSSSPRRRGWRSCGARRPRATSLSRNEPWHEDAVRHRPAGRAVRRHRRVGRPDGRLPDRGRGGLAVRAGRPRCLRRAAGGAGPADLAAAPAPRRRPPLGRRAELVRRDRVRNARRGRELRAGLAADRPARGRALPAHHLPPRPGRRGRRPRRQPPGRRSRAAREAARAAAARAVPGHRGHRARPPRSRPSSRRTAPRW